MKKHSRRISIILTLVLILTSFGFTGAFAGDEDGADPAAVDQVEAAETAEEAVVEEPSEEAVEEEAVVEEPAEEAVEEEAVVEEAVEEEPAEAEGVEGLSTETPAAPAAEGDAETVTIKWVVYKDTTTSKVNKGDVPQYEGTPMVAGYNESNYRFTGWSDGSKTYAPGVALPAATANATYTAQFVSLNVEPAKPVLKKNKNKQAYASYKSVYIEWKTIKDKNGYPYDKGVTLKCKVRPSNKKLKTKTKASKYHSEMTLDPFKTYTFYVSSVVTTADGKTLTSKETKIKGSPIKSIIYNVSIKASGTLQRHAGKGPKTYKVSAGSTIPTIRFQTGKYIFEHKGSVFYISQTRVGKASAKYNKKGTWNYTNKEAEYYIKDLASVKNKEIKKGGKSPTKNLIFVNTFCQHVYYFQKKNGEWKVTDGWECATGLASTPTPTGNYGVKYIHDKLRKKNSIPYWNLFNGNAALHATKPNDHRVGNIISNGCIRNPDAKAKKIYKKCKLKTRVQIN